VAVFMADGSAFSVTINTGGTDREQVRCTELLRVVPDNREVYGGLWGEKEVVVKFFSGPIRGRLRFGREYRGLKGLWRRGLNCPEVCFTGKTDDGRIAIVMARIAGSVNVWKYVNGACDEQGRFEVGRLLCAELARLHNKGVVQEDFHLGNFRMAGDRIYTLDTSRVRFFRPPAPDGKSKRQFCSLLRGLGIYDSAAIGRLAGVYCEVRRWPRERLGADYVREQMTALRLSSAGYTVKRWFKKKAERVKFGGEDADEWMGAVDKAYIAGVGLEGLIRSVDEPAWGGDVVSDGSIKYAANVEWNRIRVSVIRQEHRGFIRLFSDNTTTFRGRCERLYRRFCGISQLRAMNLLAYLERRRGLSIKISYFIVAIRVCGP